MGFADDLKANSYKVPGIQCSVKLWRDTQSSTDQLEFDAALAAPANEVPTVAIWRAMKTRGYTMGDGNVQRHRTHGCRCDIL